MIAKLDEKNFDEIINEINSISNSICEDMDIVDDLVKIVKILKENKEELAFRQSKENGKPIKDSLNEVDRCIAHVESGIKLLTEEKKILEKRTEQGRKIYTFYENYIPRGIVLAFTTVSSPYSSIIHKLVAALVYGNSFVYKPSPNVYACTEYLQTIIDGAISDATHKRIYCLLIEKMSIVNKLLRVMHFDCFLFTGKSENAKKIKKIIGRTAAVFETGSSAMAYVGCIEDSQMFIIAEQLIGAAYSQSGMRCIGLKNVFVRKDILDKFLKCLLEAFDRINVGNPMDINTMVGPILGQKERQTIHNEINRLLLSGYEVLGIKEINDKTYISPMLLFQSESLEPSIREIFGPVLCVHVVNSVAEIEKIYLKRSGLNISIYSSEKKEIQKFINVANYSGNICINFGPNIRLDELPFGGYEDENENKEGIKELKRILTRQQLIIKEDKEDAI